MKRKIAVWVLSVISGCLFFCSAVFGQYQIIDLGTLGGQYSHADFINNNSQIVGIANTKTGSEHAAFFDSKGRGYNTDLGTIGGSLSHAFCVNNNGTIIGYASNSGSHDRATLFDATGGASNIDLNTLLLPNSGWILTDAYSINDNGLIVGRASSSGQGGYHGFLLDLYGSGHLTDLGTLGGGNSEALSINNNGQIVGTADTSPAPQHAVLFDSTGAGNNTDLGTLGGAVSKAQSINNNGQIVGWAYDSSGHQYATLFDPSGAGHNINLGTLGRAYSIASSINNKEQIVGWSLMGSGNYHATLFDSTGNGNNIDLNTQLPPDSGWTLAVAYSINDNGWIVGSGINPEGIGHAYLLIPEPCTLALLVLGGLAVVRRRR